MGMSADVIAIGPFRRELVPYLGQPVELHAATRDGATIVLRVFETSEGSSRSRELAACFGVDPWDFQSHALDAARADLPGLRELFRRGHEGDPVAPRLDDAKIEAPLFVDVVERFVRLRDAGFAFFFRPNG